MKTGIVNYCALLIILIFVGACTTHEEVRYYPTGEVEYRAPLDGRGVFDRNVVYYYKNGGVQAILPFKNGHINGTLKRFYPNGVLESIELRKDGAMAGELKQYYPTARIKYEAVKIGERFVDTARYYHPNGEVAQLVVYDAAGRKIDFGVWNRAGKLDPAYTKPIFLSDNDELSAGEDYSFEVRLGNRRSNAVVVKPLVPAAQLDSATGKYAATRYIVKQPAPGPHAVKAKLFETWARQGSDTIWTNDYQVEHTFWVRKRP